MSMDQCERKIPTTNTSFFYRIWLKISHFNKAVVHGTTDFRKDVKKKLNEFLQVGNFVPESNGDVFYTENNLLTSLTICTY